MTTDNPENNLCPNCGYKREPDTKECPRCGIIFARLKTEQGHEVLEEEQAEDPSETATGDIPEVELDTSISGKRNLLYRLNPRTINLILFAVTALIAGILIFIYFLYLTSHA